MTKVADKGNLPEELRSAVRGALADYNGPMNLKLHLLLRMTLMGLLCWLGVSIYLVAQSGRRAAEDISRIADQLQPIVAADVMRRWIAVGSDPRFPDLGGAAARFPERVCLRYRALDASESDWGCSTSAARPDIPHWIARTLAALGPGHVALQRPIRVYGLRIGTLGVESDDASLLRRQWRSVRELLGLTAALLLAVDMLAFWVVGSALRPTAAIVAAVEQLGEGDYDVRLLPLRPREFMRIAHGVNRLGETLAHADAARADLTARLIGLQEDERRELAHELHEEFGQCVSAVGAVSASLRQSIVAGGTLTEADVAPLEIGVEHLLSSLRGMLRRMSLPPLTGQGLPSALEDLAAAWRIRLPGRPRIRLDTDPGADRLPNDERTLCAYRVVQECLTNIGRHAPTSREVLIRVRHDAKWLRVHVANDFFEDKRSRGAAGTGMGLKLLCERVRSLRGTFSANASASTFTVEASIPMDTRR